MSRWFAAALLSIAVANAAHANAPAYTVVVSKSTRADAGWAKVVEALVKKHNAQVIEFDGSVESALPALKKQHPRFTCFVATSAEAGKAFVASVHQLTDRMVQRRRP